MITSCRHDRDENPGSADQRADASPEQHDPAATMARSALNKTLDMKAADEQLVADER